MALGKSFLTLWRVVSVLSSLVALDPVIDLTLAQLVQAQ